MDKDNRKPISERLPALVFARVHHDIGRASMCWSNIDEAGEFDVEEAGKIAFELCHFIADEIDKKGAK